MRPRKNTIKYFAGLALLVGSCAVNAGLIKNGSFDTNLDHWDVDFGIQGTGVTWDSGQARVGQPGPDGFASLSQSFSIAAGTSSLSVNFDYEWQVEKPTKPDFFTAILSYDTVGGGTTTHNLLGTAPNGQSSNDVDFLTTYSYSGTFALTDLLDAPMNGLISFKLIEDNGTSRGTRVHVDNVSVSVPEPSILALFGLGLFGLGFARRRKI